MQLEELVVFFQWLNQEVRRPKLVDLYQQLYNVISRNVQPNQPKQSFESQRAALIDAVSNVKVDLLNDAQTRFADQIGLLNFVGPRAKDAIEDVLFKNVIDLATATQKIKEFQNSLYTILQKMSQVSDGLSDYVEAAPPEYEETLVHIRFQHNASINNVVELKKWSDAWYDIWREITLVNQLAPEDVRVIGASRGSLVCDLAVPYSAANMLMTIVLGVLKVADRVLDIRKKAEELRGMKLSNDEAAQELDREAEKVKKEGHAVVLAAVKSARTTDGKQNTALSDAIGKIFDFVSGGGEIDIHIKEGEEHPAEGEAAKPDNKRVIAEIKESFKEIKRLERKVILLNEENA